MIVAFGSILSTMDIVEKCSEVWRCALSDNEKLAAIFIIVKLIKSTNVSCAQLRAIYNIMGSTFLSRLLNTNTTDLPEGCPPDLYKNVALSVMACFCSDPQIAESDEMCAMINVITNTLSITDARKAYKSLTVSALECVYGMANHENSRRLLIQNDIVPILVNIYVNGDGERAKSFDVLMLLAHHCKSEIWEDKHELFNVFMNKVANDFGGEYFKSLELCKTMVTILINHPNCKVSVEKWVFKIRATLSKILTSKITKELRDPALKLASLMVEIVGVYWLAEDTKKSRFFYLMLVQLVCVEVRLVLEEAETENVLKETYVLSSCFSIIEKVMSFMADENLWSPFRPYTKQLMNSIRTAYYWIIDFILKVSLDWDAIYCCKTDKSSATKELTYASIRVLCAGLAEEAPSLPEEVCKVLPFVLRVCNESFLAVKQQETLFPKVEDSHIDLMRFLIPPLCHLTADDKTREILLKHDMHVVLFEYLYFQWSVYKNVQSAEVETLLATLCEIIMSTVVIEAKFVADSECFFDFLKFLFSIVPDLNSMCPNLRLKANFSALGLLITRHFYKRVKSCETSFYRFLSFSVKFLWDAHQVIDTNDTVEFVVMMEYSYVWNYVMELWYLGLQALSSLLPLMPWITVFLMESGWPQHIVTSFSRVGKNAIRGETKSAYQAFLCALVRVGNNVIKSLADCDAIKVCEKHKLSELETLLKE